MISDCLKLKKEKESLVFIFRSSFFWEDEEIPYFKATFRAVGDNSEPASSFEMMILLRLDGFFPFLSYPRARGDFSMHRGF